MPDTRLGKQNRRREHYDRFDGSEMERRWSAVRERMRAAELDALVVAGDAGFGRTHIGYLTNYHPPFVSYFVFFADPDRPSLLLAGLSNHKQYVREVSEADDVEIMLPDPMGRVADRLEAGGAADGRVGIVGHHPRYDQGLSHEHYVALSGSIRGELVDATRTLIEVGSVKSEPELERIRRAAELTDLGLETLAETAEPGVTERGGLGIAFITSAPMEGAESGEPLPWHKPSGRELRDGDVITTEMSAAHRGYRSQVHRTFVVGAEPSDVYGDLWETARTAYDRMLDAIRPGNTVRDVHEALGVIERSPYRLYDVGLHGYGNGYLPPYVGTAASKWTFRENQVVVVQPNVVTESERHGLQLGSAVIVREGGPEVLQTYPLPIVEL